MPNPFANQHALVTGAGSGIGRATALLLGQLGASLTLCDRNPVALQETTDLLTIKGTLDVLVNNAGVGTAGPFLDTPIEDWQWVMGINLMGVVHGCKAFGARMAADKRGHIVNIASAAGYYAASDMSAYSASKHAVMGLTESLRLEMAVHGVGVSAICPGVINTNIVAATRMHGSTAKSQDKLVAIYQKRNYGPEHVAEAVVSAITGNRAVVPVSPEAWALYAGKRFLPGVMDAMQRTAWFRKLKPS